MSSKRSRIVSAKGASAWLLVGLPLGVAALVTAASCTDTPPPAGLAVGCEYNSDCQGDLICAYGRCHAQCMSSRDCNGATCLTPDDVCELLQETPCTTMLPCVIGLTCADDVCRAPCTPGVANNTTGGCLASQTCTEISGQYVCIDAAGDGGAGSKDSGSRDSSSHKDGHVSSSDGNGPVPDGNPCQSPQTQFGTTAHGESNPSFQSGVGARTATDLFIFSGYVGPGSTGSVGDAGASNAVYVQAFDPKTSQPRASAQLLFTQQDLVSSSSVGTQMLLYSSAVAPTGQIALVYTAAFATGAPGLYAAFLGSASDAGTPFDGGAAGLTLQSVQLLATNLTDQTHHTQPHVIWSSASESFVVSWSYSPSGGRDNINVSKFLVGGGLAGGGTSTVPTNDQYGNVVGAFGSGPECGSVGESGDLFGVAYGNVSNGFPMITTLDAPGSLVGAPVELATNEVGNWVSVAGTSKGFVYFYDSSSAAVVELFLAPSGDAGVAGGFLDGGEDAGFPTYSFAAGQHANAGRAISDGPGGAGGVGLALLNSDGVTFSYVGADGKGLQGPGQIFVHTYVTGDEISMTNFAGSFVLSLYSATLNSTELVASGCQ